MGATICVAARRVRSPGMQRRKISTSGSRALAMVVAAALVAAACSSESGGVELPDESDAVVAEEVVALAAAPTGSWGDGRALIALPVGGASTAVVTTTGVFVTDADGATTNLDLFGEPTEVGAAAVSDDGTLLAVVSLWPTVVRWYHLGEQRPLSVDDIGVGGDISAFGFLGGTDVLTVVASTGLTMWPLGSAGGSATPLEGDVPAGAATFAGDRLVVPLAGGNQLAIVGPSSVDRIDIDLPAGARLLGAESSPDAATLAVAYFDPAAGDSIAVVDAATSQRIGTVAVEAAVRPGAWAVTDRAVAVSDGVTVTTWTHGGELLGSQTTPSDQTADELLARHDGIAAVHHAGATALFADDGVTPPRLLDAGGITVEHAVIDHELDRLVTVDYYGRIAEQDLDVEGEPVHDDRFAAGNATSVSISAGDGSTIAVGATNGRVALLDSSLAPTGGLAVRAVPAQIDDVAFNPGSGLLSTGLAERITALSFDDNVTTWNAGDGAAVHSFGGEAEEVADCGFFHSRVAFTADGSLMAVTSHDFTVALLDAETGELVHRFETVAGTTLDIEFAQDDELLIATSELGTVTVWNVGDRTVTATYDAPLGGFRSIDLMPDGTTMAAVDTTGTLQLVDVLTGQSLLRFDGSAISTTSIALSPDGAMLAAPSDDSSITVWSTDSGLPLAELDGHTAVVTDIAFAPDGTWLVTSSDDGTARRWDLTIST